MVGAMRQFVFDEIDSTNAEALRLIEAGRVAGWTVVTARRQTAGRGRRDRTWSSPAGNLHASFCIPRDRRDEWRRPWLLGFALSLAIHDTVSALVEDGTPVSLKWPNDVLAGGAKISGLLLETSGVLPFVVAGIGINIASHPADTPYPATHLDRHRGTPIPPEAVLGQLSAAVPARTEQWLELGFADVRAAVLARGHRPGDAVTVRTGENAHAGTFVDLDADGCLVLDENGTRRRFSTGDVFPALRP